MNCKTCGHDILIHIKSVYKGKYFCAWPCCKLNIYCDITEKEYTENEKTNDEQDAISR